MFSVAMFPPNSTVPEYIPEGFGFTAHKHTADINAAAKYPTQERAALALRSYWWPDAFWESERRHRAAMEKEFKGWRFEIVAARNRQPDNLEVQ